MPRKIIIDCDPGYDDAMAILLAHGNPQVELCAITSVAGNQTLDKTTLNARRICSVARIAGVPVAAGCDRPLLRPLITAPETLGESWLDGPGLGTPATPLAAIHAIDLIIDLVMGAPGQITLVPIGPLTNIALALRKEPRLAAAVREVVLMGGAQTRGNATPAAEFNIFVDPEAAAIVFGAGWPITMIGLDLTRQALATPEVIERISALGTPLASIAVKLIRAFASTHKVISGSPPIHDPCAVARIIDPALVECVPGYVTVETHGTTTSGMTSVDFDNRCGDEPNALVATKLDFDGFWNLVLDAIHRIG
jgi:purine nucleosidase